MTDQFSVDYVPTVAEVERITAISDPTIRNLQITQCYYELSKAMSARTGVNANWCTFATWASKQAGQTIRKEDFKRIWEQVLSSAPFSAQAASEFTSTAQAFGSTQDQGEIQETVADVLNPLAALDRASDAVARGNKKVFEEIGREFARFLAFPLDDHEFNAEQTARFCTDLRDGAPPDGQQYLRQAFMCYAQARFENDAMLAAQKLLLANIAIGFHEQTRLQPEIAEAMDAAFVDRRQFRLRLIQALFPYRGWLARVRLFFLWLFNRPSPFDAALDQLHLEARQWARLVITEYLLILELPPGVQLRMGQELMREFPDSLKQITLPDLNALLMTLDPTPERTGSSEAVDWSRLPDRLHLIIDLFRCYHESVELFDPPFTAEQVTLLKAGRLPEGRL